MKHMKSKTLWMLTAATVIATGAAGCKSSSQTQVDASADEIDHNRLLVRLALAENVYNGTATDRAVYPKDFDYGSASLNPLGTRRVEILIHAYRGGAGRIVVLQGDESEELYAQRIASVSQQFADAGIKGDQIVITKGGTLPAGTSSERASLSFDRMMSEYRAKEGASAKTNLSTDLKGGKQ